MPNAQTSPERAFESLVTLEGLLHACDAPRPTWDALLDAASPMTAAEAIWLASEAARRMGTDDCEKALHLLALEAIPPIA